MPKLERSFKSMGSLNATHAKQKLIRSYTANDILVNFDEPSVSSAIGEDRFLSEERLANRDKERTDIGRMVFRPANKLPYHYYTDNGRFPAAHLKSQNLQSAEHIANFSNNRRSPYSDRKWKMQSDSISFRSISDDEIGVHRSVRNNTSALGIKTPATSGQTRTSPYSRRRPRGFSISQHSLPNETDKQKQEENTSQSIKDLDLEIVSDHFNESDSLISDESSGFEMMAASSKGNISCSVGSSGGNADSTKPQNNEAITQYIPTKSSNI